MTKAEFKESLVRVFGEYEENDSFIETLSEMYTEEELNRHLNSVAFARYLKGVFSSPPSTHVRNREFALFMSAFDSERY